MILGLLIAIAVCASFIGYGLWEGTKYERQAHDQRSKNSEYTSQKIAQTCVGIPQVEAIKCRYDALDAQREHDNNQRDLVAQRQSALWAYIMGAASVIGIALSAVGVWLVKTTFDETRKSNEIAMENIKITKSSDRPFLSIETPKRSTNTEFNNDLFGVGIWLELKNYGSKPANWPMVYTVLKIVPASGPLPYQEVRNSELVDALINPQKIGSPIFPSKSDIAEWWTWVSLDQPFADDQRVTFIGVGAVRYDWGDIRGFSFFDFFLDTGPEALLYRHVKQRSFRVVETRVIVGLTT